MLRDRHRTIHQTAITHKNPSNRRKSPLPLHRHIPGHRSGECPAQPYIYIHIEVINFLTNFERNYTITNRQTSLAIKSILAQMINSILIPVIVAHYIKGDLYNTSGLVDNIFMMSITGSFVGPALVFFDPLNIVNKLLRCMKSRAGTLSSIQAANSRKTSVTTTTST